MIALPCGSKYEGALVADVPEPDLRLLLRHRSFDLPTEMKQAIFAELDRRAAVARLATAKANERGRRKRFR